jgi:hypothetical protein
MALATPADVADRLGRPLTPDDQARVDSLLAEASVLAAAWMGHTPDPVPGPIAIAVSRMTARALTTTTEPGVTNMQTTVGPFAVTRAYTPAASSGGVWLGKQDKLLLRPYATRSVANQRNQQTW